MMYICILYMVLCLFIYIYYSAIVRNVESKRDHVINWNDTYLLVCVNDIRPLLPFQNGRKLKNNDKCLVVTFDAEKQKYALGIFKQSVIIQRLNSKARIKYFDEHKAIDIPIQVRIKNDIIPSVVQKIPVFDSTPFILLKQKLMKNQFNVMPEPNCDDSDTNIIDDNDNHTDSEVHDLDEELDIVMDNTQHTNDADVDEFNSQSANTDHAASTVVQQVNQHMFSKSFTKEKNGKNKRQKANN